MTTALQVIAEARKHVGYIEGPKKNNIFGKWYGANGQPWCAMFVSYCINKAGGGQLIKGAQTEKGFASCGAGIRFFTKKKAWYPAFEAKPGDLVFFDWDLDGQQDHVGIVVKNYPKRKLMDTIEGNVSGTSQSNGGRVGTRTRSYTNIMGVGRPAYATGSPVSPVEATKPTASPSVAPKPAKPSTKPTAHKVKAGDSYWSIGKKYGINYLTLVKLNKAKKLQPGDTVKLS